MIERIKLSEYEYRYSYKLDSVELGYTLVEDALDIINITCVFVTKNFRRKGIASKLLKKVFEDFSDRNIKYMLEVREDNIGAINLYKKLGFRVIYVREKYYKDINALIMEMK